MLGALALPWACSDNSNPSTPGGPSLGGGATATPTFPIVSTPGTATATPTSAVPAPSYLSEWAAAAAPNGFYLDSTNNQLYVAEADSLHAGVQVYDTTNLAGAITFQSNLVLLTVGGASTTVVLNHPLGLAWVPFNPYSSYFVILDGTSSGGASIYSGTSPMLADVNTGTNYGNGAPPFKNPTGFTTNGYYFYIADTGNGYVYEIDPSCGPNPCPVHPWNGYSPNNFLKPSHLACSPIGTNDNIWVADTGYNPSLISCFKSSGVTWVTQFATIPNCVVNGMAVTVDSGGNDVVYVSDSANQLVEEYDHNGNLLRSWGNPHGPHQFNPFKPSAIAIDTNNGHILVGDQNNRTVEVFGP